jgi:hypothetical protein
MLLPKDRARRGSLAAKLAPRQGWKPVRVKTAMPGFSEADSPVPAGETPVQI